MKSEVKYAKVLEEKLKYLVDPNEITETKNKLLQILTKIQVDFENERADMEKAQERERFKVAVKRQEEYLNKELGICQLGIQNKNSDIQEIKDRIRIANYVLPQWEKK